MFPDADGLQSEIKSKFPTLQSITRHWIVYCQIHEIAEPGILLYILCHLLQLSLLYDQYNSFSAILNYHLKVAGHRINMGVALPKREWCVPQHRPRCYAYIDEKLRGEAMSGIIAPDKLPFLLPDTSRYLTYLRILPETSRMAGRPMAWIVLCVRRLNRQLLFLTTAFTVCSYPGASPIFLLQPPSRLPHANVISWLLATYPFHCLARLSLCPIMTRTQLPFPACPTHCRNSPIVDACPTIPGCLTCAPYIILLVGHFTHAIQSSERP